MNLLNGPETLSFVRACVKQKDYPYCWPTKENKYSGKGLHGSLYPNGRDCSGVITSALFEATNGRIDRRATWNAQKLMENCRLVDSPSFGDLCFYGPARALITHVMVYTGKNMGPFIVFGASGGNSKTVNPEIAKAMNASVRGFKSVNYRKDYLFSGRLATNGD